LQKVKMGLDSGFKQVIREFDPGFLFGADGRRRNAVILPEIMPISVSPKNLGNDRKRPPAVRWKVLPERRSVFEKSRPGGVQLCSIPQVLSICREE
jgi:hypothetical protein